MKSVIAAGTDGSCGVWGAGHAATAAADAALAVGDSAAVDNGL